MTQKQIIRLFKKRLKKNNKILHHGACMPDKIDFVPSSIGTDYFGFFCRKCDVEIWIYAILIDERGRIIFNLQCPECQKTDAIKVAVNFTTCKYSTEKGDTKIQLSPTHKKNIGNHWWDDF